MSLKPHQMYTSQSLIIQVKPSFSQFPAHLFILIISHISSATVQLLKSIMAYSFLAHHPTLSAEVSFSICHLVNLCEKLSKFNSQSLDWKGGCLASRSRSVSPHRVTLGSSSRHFLICNMKQGRLALRDKICLCSNSN